MENEYTLNLTSAQGISSEDVLDEKKEIPLDNQEDSFDPVDKEANPSTQDFAAIVRMEKDEMLFKKIRHLTNDTIEQKREIEMLKEMVEMLIEFKK